MATPEYIGLRCDHCGCDYMDMSGHELAIFQNHSEAYACARADEWYIDVWVELCSNCAEAYAIERTSEDEAAEDIGAIIGECMYDLMPHRHPVLSGFGDENVHIWSLAQPIAAYVFTVGAGTITLGVVQGHHIHAEETTVDLVGDPRECISQLICMASNAEFLSRKNKSYIPTEYPS
jgi:hypothetical protein